MKFLEQKEVARLASQGTAKGTVDAKGRASLPARLRKDYEGLNEVMVWYSGNPSEPHLLLATQQEYDRVFRREYRKAAPENRSRVMRRFQVNSQPVELDRNGRFGMPEELALKAGILRDETVFYIGCHTHLEIWKLDNWLAQEDRESGTAETADDLQLNFAPEPEWLFDSMEEDKPALSIVGDTADKGTAP